MGLNEITNTTTPAEAGSVSRRDVLKVVWTTPVILAVSPSLKVSAGSPTTVAGGLTPGFWKQSHHLQFWTNHTPDDDYATTFGVSVPQSGGPKGKKFQNQSQSFTLSDALNQGGGGELSLRRHATAALLNASNPNVPYLYTEEEVKSLVQQAYQDKAYEEIKLLLEEQNELGFELK